MTSIQYSAESKPVRSMRKRLAALAAGGLILAVVAAVGLAKFPFWASAPGPAAAPLIPVQIATVTRRDVPVYLDGLGTVQAFNTVTLKTQVDGQLQSVLFTEGQNVKKGDLLAVVDPRPFQSALDQAVAKIEQDKANIANAQYLLQKDQELATKIITTAEQVEMQQATLDGFKAQLTQDQAARDDAAVQLSYTQLRSPIDGRTGFRQVDQGNQVQTTDVNGVVVITQTQPISVISTLSEDDLPVLQTALKAGPVQVTAFTRDGGTALSTGTLSTIDNEIDQTTGTVRLKSTFANADEKLWPGQFIDLRVLQKTLAGATTIPSPALQRGPEGFFVYLVNSDNTVSPHPVTPGPIADETTVIASGLSAGERVVTSGQYRLEPGSKVSFASPSVVAPSATSKGN
ncbi:efflux RND transporter periplasmic adaptor subunit [Rhizobium sp. Root1220]|uniref:efflux RND transporter periplasmic adaptor subunit n=1 Tax=Rhizobium sp. Root1220 TaxID=1736432 RepID=UPI0006FC8378|nr:efflux RND transporter periplasmic adaptor subunit [Rhizobium sp. Root1220]KQV70207.1 RND transporter [Rhizobium sp. Root1220]